MASAPGGESAVGVAHVRPPSLDVVGEDLLRRSICVVRGVDEQQISVRVGREGGRRSVEAVVAAVRRAVGLPVAGRHTDHLPRGAAVVRQDHVGVDLRGGALIVVALREHDVPAVRRHPSTAGEEIAVLVGDLLRDERGASIVRDADEAVPVAGSVVRDEDVLSRRRDGQPGLVRPRGRHADGCGPRPAVVRRLGHRHAGLEPLEPRGEHRPVRIDHDLWVVLPVLRSPGRHRGTGRVPTSVRRRRKREGRSMGSGRKDTGPVRCIGSRGCRHTEPMGPRRSPVPNRPRRPSTRARSSNRGSGSGAPGRCARSCPLRGPHRRLPDAPSSARMPRAPRRRGCGSLLLGRPLGLPLARRHRTRSGERRGSRSSKGRSG